MGRILWTEEKILNWINTNDLSGFKFVKITKLDGLYSKLLFICPKCKRDYEVCFKNFKRGQRCGCDKGKRNHTYQDVIEETSRKNLEILDDDGTYSYKKKFKLRCENSHIFHMTLNDLLRGHGCPHCSKNAKLTYEYVEKYFMSYGYKLISEKYINANSHLIVKCPKGHIYKVRYSDFSRGKRCPYCNMSSGEQEIVRILDKYNIEYNIQFTFKECKNILELPFDFYLPKYNTLIEYDGEQHYSLRFEDTIDDFIKRKVNDGIKNEYCYFNNLPLIRIPYWEFNNIEKIICQELNNKYE